MNKPHGLIGDLFILKDTRVIKKAIFHSKATLDVYAT